MRSWFFVMLCGAFLLSSCGGSSDAPAPAPEKAAKAEPPPPPPAPEPAAEEPAADAAPEAGGDCPAALDEYDKFVDKYVSYIKKAANGDASALTEVAGLMSQADKAGQELAAAQGDMTVDCLKKYNEINKKMTDAALEMSKASAPEQAQVEAAQEAADAAIEAAGDAASCMQKCQGMTDPMAAATCMQGCM